MSKSKAQRLQEGLALSHLKALPETAKKLVIPDRSVSPKNIEEIRATANSLRWGNGVSVLY